MPYSSTSNSSVSTQKVKVAIDGAERAFERCWSLIDAMKEGKIAESKVSLLDFQPLLAETLLVLSDLHRKINSEKELRIRNKANLSIAWFKKRMRFLDAQRSIVEKAIIVGKGIGDSFAWFFYQNNRQYLHEHLREPEQLLIPSGVGGSAEIEIIKQVPIANGCFVLYHGMTSILRLGDVSLISLQPLRVVTVGELKAGKPADGRLTITLVFPQRIENVQGTMTKRGARSDAPSAIDGLSAAAKDRLQRQFERMKASFHKINSRPAKQLTLEMENRIGELQKFLSSIGEGRCALHQIGASVLLVGVQSKGKSMYQRLTGPTSARLRRQLDGTEVAAASLVSGERKDNAIFVSDWFYRRDGKPSHRPGMTHPTWWPVPAESIRRVIFQEVNVFTVFNPAHLFAALELDGYELTIEWPKKFSAKKRIGNRFFSLGGVEHYFEVIQRYLFSERDVVGLLGKVQEQLPSYPPGNGQIDIDIVQMFGDPSVT